MFEIIRLNEIKKKEREEKKRDSRDFIQQIFIQPCPITDEFEEKVIKLYINIYIYEIFRKLSRRVAIKRVGTSGNFSFEREDGETRGERGGGGGGNVKGMPRNVVTLNLVGRFRKRDFTFGCPGRASSTFIYEKSKTAIKAGVEEEEERVGEGMIPIETLIIIIIIIPFSFHRCLFDAAFSFGP